MLIQSVIPNYINLLRLGAQIAAMNMMDVLAMVLQRFIVAKRTWALVALVVRADYCIVKNTIIDKEMFLLLKVNCDKKVHARWNFDASSAWTRRLSAQEKHKKTRKCIILSQFSGTNILSYYSNSYKTFLLTAFFRCDK